MFKLINPNCLRYALLASGDVKLRCNALNRILLANTVITALSERWECEYFSANAGPSILSGDMDHLTAVNYGLKKLMGLISLPFEYFTPLFGL